jgi:hypothetical protein
MPPEGYSDMSICWWKSRDMMRSVQS